VKFKISMGPLFGVLACADMRQHTVPVIQYD